MSESLDHELKEHFKNASNADLVRAIETAPEFRNDDAVYELNRRLGEIGMKWAFVTYRGVERVQMYRAREDESGEVLGYD